MEENNTLYISDLDGTLLRNDAALSEFSRSTLCELLHDGLHFTVASARSVVSMRHMLHGLPLRLPVIEFNGAFISDLESGRHQIVNNIEPDVVESVYGLIRSFRCSPFISSFNGAEDCLYYQDVINKGMEWYAENRRQIKDKRLRSIADLTHSFRDQIVCFTIIGHADALLDLESAIRELHASHVETHIIENQYSPGWYWLTVHDYRATKDQAIAAVREELGFNDHELAVFGDQSNDIKMFQIADRAFAVANATPELKGYATQVIGSNQEDSVARFIHDDYGKPNRSQHRA